jgi:hypothetical protein
MVVMLMGNARQTFCGGRSHVGRSRLLPLLAKFLRGSAISACVKILGNVYDFLTAVLASFSGNKTKS